MKSLYTKAHGPLLELKFLKLGLQWYTEIKSLPTSPDFDCISDPPKYILFNKKDKDKVFWYPLETFSGRRRNITSIHDTIRITTSPWLLKQMVVILELRMNCDVALVYMNSELDLVSGNSDLDLVSMDKYQCLKNIKNELGQLSGVYEQWTRSGGWKQWSWSCKYGQISISEEYEEWTRPVIWCIWTVN